MVTLLDLAHFPNLQNVISSCRLCELSQLCLEIHRKFWRWSRQRGAGTLVNTGILFGLVCVCVYGIFYMEVQSTTEYLRSSQLYV